MIVRIEKPLARRLATILAPECGETLAAFREKRDGWVRFPSELEQARKNTGLGDAYVLTYEDELRIHSCLLRWAFPENTAEAIKELEVEFCGASSDEKLDALNQILDVDFEDFDALFNLSEDEKEKLRQSFKALPEEEKIVETHRAQNLLAFAFAYFYNTLSLMVHGQKLTSLVPLALQGDKEAFCKAIQIDRNILTGHPYFRDTYAKLQTGADIDFLDAIRYRIGNPTTRGKIRFPALYMVFATLDSFNWLDDFTASEILDICDEARLDRFQNRIEDENYLIKRRIEYRQFQKISK